MTDSFTLPARFDNASVPALRQALLDLRGMALRLDARHVEVADSLALQLVLATRKQWQMDGRDYALVSASRALVEACHSLGVAPADIGVEVAP